MKDSALAAKVVPLAVMNYRSPGRIGDPRATPPICSPMIVPVVGVRCRSSPVIVSVVVSVGSISVRIGPVVGIRIGIVAIVAISGVAAISVVITTSVIPGRVPAES